MTATKRLIYGLMILWPACIAAQENSPSPYSFFGIGDLQYGDISRVSGMASTALSLSGRTMLNTANPASLSALDSNLFILDMSASLRGSHYSSGTDVMNAFSANFTGLSAGLRITPRWSAAVAVQPYSTVSYVIGYDEYTEGTQVSTPTRYTGSGGVTRFSLLSSFNISRSLSLGADLMLLAGNIDREVTRNEISISRSSTGARMSFVAGLQYKEAISGDMSLSVGAVYGHSCDLSFDNSLLVTDESGSILMQDVIASSSIDVPRSYGAGISLEGKRFTVAADYRYQKWSLVRNQFPNFSFTDTYRISSGIMFRPRRSATGSVLNALEYQAGFALSNSYLTINTVNPVRYEVTAGAGVPFRSGSQINLGFTFGRQGTTAEGLVREDYIRLSLSFSMAERMFFKRMYE
jgi:hypothetical protein